MRDILDGIPSKSWTLVVRFPNTVGVIFVVIFPYCRVIKKMQVACTAAPLVLTSDFFP